MVIDKVTWELLGSYAGASIVTYVVLSLLKKGKSAKIKKYTWLIAYVFGVILLLCAAFFTNSFTSSKIVLCFVNGFIVALIAVNGCKVLPMFGKGQLLSKLNNSLEVKEETPLDDSEIKEEKQGEEEKIEDIKERD